MGRTIAQTVELSERSRERESAQMEPKPGFNLLGFLARYRDRWGVGGRDETQFQRKVERESSNGAQTQCF